MELHPNSIVRYAVHPADQGRIEYIDGMPWAWPKTLPRENDRLTLDFLVDPTTRQPIPIRVAEVLAKWNGAAHDVVVLVTLDQ